MRKAGGDFMHWRCLVVLAAAITANSTTAYGQDSSVSAQAERIDTLIGARLRAEQITPSPPADDAEFLRRVYLDLTGQIPPYDKAVAFLESNGPGRRAKLIDELLAAPEFGRHFAGLWSQLILGNEIPNNSRELFRTWLAEQLNQGQGWDKIVFEMLTAEGDLKQNPATVFVLAQTDDGKITPNLLAATTTRYFLGVQLQCAECHNHPFTNWKQSEFWGMAAFFTKVKNLPASKTATVTGISEAPLPSDPKKNAKPPAVVEAAIVIPNTAGKAAGTSVRAKFLDADEPTIRPEDPFRPSLASWVTAADNKYFARATVNRLWAMMFGRGLVNPVDDMHAENLSIHAELLDFLTDEFKSSGFDVKHLLRCICNSQTYQRTSRPVQGNADDHETFSHMAGKVMNPEVLYDALTRALAVKELNVVTGKATTIGIGGAAKASPASNRDKFIRFFKTQDADSVATEFTHGIPQALNLMNDPQFTRGTPVVDQLLKAKLTPEQAIERLFLTVLTRRPTATESERLLRYVEDQGDAARGYTGVVWVLINTPEFIINH